MESLGSAKPSAAKRIGLLRSLRLRYATAYGSEEGFFLALFGTTEVVP
jgi:hypothetical protein